MSWLCFIYLISLNSTTMTWCFCSKTVAICQIHHTQTGSGPCDILSTAVTLAPQTSQAAGGPAESALGPGLSGGNLGTWYDPTLGSWKPLDVPNTLIVFTCFYTFSQHRLTPNLKSYEATVFNTWLLEYISLYGLKNEKPHQKNGTQVPTFWETSARHLVSVPGALGGLEITSISWHDTSDVWKLNK